MLKFRCRSTGKNSIWDNYGNGLTYAEATDEILCTIEWTTDNKPAWVLTEVAAHWEVKNTLTGQLIKYWIEPMPESEKNEC